MRLLSSLVAAAAVLALSAPVAGATPAPGAAAPPILPCWSQHGAGWTPGPPAFSSCAACEQAGAAGVSRGDWADYRCGWVPIGLDIAYRMFLPASATPTGT